MSVLQKLIAMLLLKAAPQDLPYAKSLAVKLAMVYWISGLVILSTTLQPAALMESMLLSVIILGGFVYGLLALFGLQARFIQTFAAVIGVSTLFNVMSWPILALFSDEPDQESLAAVLSLAFLMLLSWEVLVKAHIFKNAMEVSTLNALLLSLALFFIAMTLSQLLFPG